MDRSQRELCACVCVARALRVRVGRCTCRAVYVSAGVRVGRWLEQDRSRRRRVAPGPASRRSQGHRRENGELHEHRAAPAHQRAAAKRDSHSAHHTGAGRRTPRDAAGRRELCADLQGERRRGAAPTAGEGGEMAALRSDVHQRESRRSAADRGGCRQPFAVGVIPPIWRSLYQYGAPYTNMALSTNMALPINMALLIPIWRSLYQYGAPYTNMASPTNMALPPIWRSLYQYGAPYTNMALSTNMALPTNMALLIPIWRSLYQYGAPYQYDTIYLPTYQYGAPPPPPPPPPPSSPLPQHPHQCGVVHTYAVSDLGRTIDVRIAGRLNLATSLLYRLPNSITYVALFDS